VGMVSIWNRLMVLGLVSISMIPNTLSRESSCNSDSDVSSVNSDIRRVQCVQVSVLNKISHEPVVEPVVACVSCSNVASVSVTTSGFEMLF